MNDKMVFRIVMALTVVVLLVVVALRFIERPGEMPAFAKALPALNAAINSTCTLLLLASLACVKRGRVSAHK